MAWRRPGDKPLSEPMMVSLPTHICVARPQWVNTLRPRQNSRHFADDIFQRILLKENVWISIKLSLKLVPKSPINNIPAIFRSRDKPLSEPMMVNLLTHICVTRLQWVTRYPMAIIIPCFSFLMILSERSRKCRPVVFLILNASRWSFRVYYSTPATVTTPASWKISTSQCFVLQ